MGERLVMSSRKNEKCNKDSWLLECVKSTKPTAKKLIELRQCLERKADVNARDEDGNTALLLAVHRAKMSVLKLLLQWGADVKKPNLEGYTPLHIAARFPNTSVVELLLNKGADVNAQTSSLDTPLHEAARSGNVAVVKLLLKNDAKMNTLNISENTPLHEAACSGTVSVVELLLSEDTDVSKKSKNLLLHKAAFFGNIPVLELLIKNGCVVDATDGDGPLFEAVKSGNPSVVLLLLNCGADVNGQSKRKYSALHLAASLGNTSIVELLLDKNAELNAQTIDGVTPLHEATRKGNAAIVKLLLDRGADVDAGTRNNVTPLHKAVYFGDTSIILMLLNKNARIDAPTRYGNTPLHLAVCQRNAIIVNLLLKRGANATLSNQDGYTPLHVAVCFEKLHNLNSMMCYRDDIQSLVMFEIKEPEHRVPYFMETYFDERQNDVDMNKLFSYGKNRKEAYSEKRTLKERQFYESNFDYLDDFLRDTPFHIEGRSWNKSTKERSNKNRESSKDISRDMPIHNAEADNMSILVQLLSNITDVNVQDRMACTPLHKAAQYGNASAIELLFNKGADVNVQNKDGCMPLHEAARFGVTLVVELLLQKGADLTARTFQGDTPLHIAASTGNKCIAELLLKEGAEVNLENDSGFTPLHKAARFGNTPLVKLLLNKGARVKARANNGDTPLHEAVLSGNPFIIEMLLNEGAEINAQNINAITPLHKALGSKLMTVVKLLLNKGADANTKDEEGNTPLLEAVRSKNTSVIEILLNRNIDVNVTDKQGKTALLEAVKTENTSVVELLLNKDSDVNVKDEEGNTPLMEAIRSGNESIIKLLLKKNPDVNMKNEQGNAPLLEAIKSGKTAVVELLLKDSDVDVKDEQENTLLFEAVRSQNSSVVEMLLHKNPNVNVKDKLGKTLLGEAVRLGNTAVVALLMNKDIDVNVKNVDGRTVLHEVANSDKDAIVALLLKNGANMNEQDKYGETPLHKAAQHGKTSIIKLLLSKNADVNAQKADGETPLHTTMYTRTYEIVNLLIEKGAKINAQDRIGDTPLHKLVKRGQEFDAERMLKKYDFIISDDKKRPYFKDINVAELLLRKGANVNARNDHGKTPLHEAACYGRTSIARLLLERNADVNAQTIDGETPLHQAVRHENVTLVTLLLIYKANVLLRDNMGDTPLTHALLFYFEGNKKILSLLQTAEEEGLKLATQTTLDIFQDINQEKTCFNDLQNEQLKYMKSNDNSGLPGQLYETKMVSLVFIRMLNRKNLEHDFFLGVNVDGAGAIDDICLRCRVKNEKKPIVLFIQAKQKENPNVKVTEKVLWSDSGDFSIPKYFKSYLMIKKRFQVGNKDDMFEGNFNDVDCYFILYTSANENFAKKKTVNEINKDVQDLIYTSNTARHFQYNYDEADIDRLVSKMPGEARVNFEENSDANLNPTEYARIQVKEFFSRLWFFTGQAKEDIVERLVKDEISRHYNHENNLNQYTFELHSNAIFLRAHDKIQKWWMSKNKSYLRRSDDFFKLAKLACLADVFLTGVHAVNSLKISVNLEFNHYIKLNTTQRYCDNFIVQPGGFNAILRSLFTLINTENILISLNKDLKNKIEDLLLSENGTESVGAIGNIFLENGPHNAVSINEKFEYSNRDGTSEVGGVLFRTKMLSLVLLRVLNHELIEQNPLLGTKIRGISVMNDICLRYRFRSQEKPVVLFAQLVHRDNIEKRTVTDDALWKESEDFNLKKYFNSFFTIKERFQCKNHDPMFEEEFNNVDCHFVLYTSANETVTKKKTENKLDTVIQDIINTKKSIEPFQCYYDAADIEHLSNVTAMDRIDALGTKFLDFVLPNKYNANVLSNKLMSRYHVAMVREILQQCPTQTAINEFRLWEFRSEFFNSNLEYIVTLRKTFAKILAKKCGQSEIVNLEQQDVISEYVRQKLKLRNFKLPLAFGNLDMTFRGDQNKVQKRIKTLAGKVIYLLELNKETKIVEINDDDVGSKKMLEQGIVNINGGIGGAVGNLLVLDTKSSMLKFDLENKELLPNAASFLKELKDDKYKPFNEYLSDYRFKINTFGFPKYSFCVDENDKAQARDFLNKFWLCPNQAKEDEVERILKYEINEKYYSKIRNNHNQNTDVSDLISLLCLDEVQKWWLGLNESAYLSRASELFERAELADIYNLLQTVINYMYISNIHSIDIKVKHNNKNDESDQMHELFKKIVVKIFNLFDPQFDEHFVLRRKEFEISERSTLSLRIHPQMEWVALTVTRRKTSEMENIDMKHCFVAKAGPGIGNRQARDRFMLRQLYSSDRVFRFKDCLKNANIEFLIHERK